jgi:Leucine-rich repeat (LRR) protein
METRKQPRERFPRLITLLASAAMLLPTGCQRDKHLSNVTASRAGSANAQPEAVPVTETDRPVETGPAIAVLEKLGGTWQVDVENQGRPVVVIDLSFKEATDAEMAQLKSFTQLEELYLIETKITDESLASINGLAGLRTLDLGRTGISDKGLAHLVGLKNLKTLGLSSTKITDAGIIHLMGLAGLQILDLSNTKVTTEGIKELQQALPNVQVLP